MTFEEELDQMFAAAVKALTSADITYEPGETRELLRKQLARARGVETPEEKPPEPVEPVEEVRPLAIAVAEGTEPYWWEPAQDTEFIDFFIRSRMAGTLDGQVLITGPSWQGKTEGVIRACDRLGVPLNIINCASITTIEKWVGHKEVGHDGTHFVMSEFLRMVEARGPEHTYPDGRPGYEPSVVLLDELTRLHATYHNLLFPLFDGLRSIFVPELHAHIAKHPQMTFIATANIGGRYSGTHQLDAALRERFPYTIERDFPPADEEVKVLTTRTGIAAAQAATLVEIANKTRAKLGTDLSLAISTRTLIYTATLVASGASIVRAFELTALPHFAKDGGQASERGLVSTIITGKGA